MSEAPDQDQAQLHLFVDPEAPSPPPTYTNYVQGTFTPEDFTLFFGWYAVPALSERPEDGVVNVPVQPVARLTVPLILMRSIIALMERQLAAYETSFGEIPEHPNKPPWLQEQEAAPGDEEDVS